MERIIHRIKLIIVMSMIVNCATATTHVTEKDGIKYTIYYLGGDHVNYAEVTGATRSGDIIIPATVTHSDGYDGGNYREMTFRVSRISSGAFRNCRDITSVYIGENVNFIGYQAFDGCSGLTSVFISKSVSNMNNYDGTLFRGCGALESIIVESGNAKYDSRNNCNALIETSTNTLLLGCKNTIIPEDVATINTYAFYNCSDLNAITIPRSITSIGNYAFQGCSNLSSIVVESGNTKYDSRNGCNAIIESATNELLVGCNKTIIPPSITSICSYAFRGSGITSIIIPKNVTSIHAQVFSDCCNLSSIVVEDGNTTYDSRDNCNAIIETESNTLRVGCKNTIIPSSVTSITWGAYSGCCDLTTLTIPSNVTSIKDYAFENCSGLTSVVIQNGATTIGQSAFEGCCSLTSVSIPSSVSSISPRIFYGCSSLSNVALSEGVKEIGANAFYGCSSLASIEIPTTVTSIGDGAFSGTAWFNNQPEGLVYVGKVAYKYKGIVPTGTAIVIKDYTLGIGGTAFYGSTGLTSVSMPSSIESIGGSAFTSCSNLTSVTINRGTPVKIYYDTFSNRKNATLYVPAGSKAAYEAADYWKEFKEIVEMEPVYPAIENFAVILDGEKQTLHGRMVTQNGEEYIITDSGIYRITGRRERLAGDVNADGKITIADVTSLVNVILGHTSAESATIYNVERAEGVTGLSGDGDFIGWGGVDEDGSLDPKVKMQRQ